MDETMTTEEKRELARERLNPLMEIRERLKPLVGPESARDDVILGSHVAREAASAGIMRSAPSPGD
jgi:hypothetical protein